MDNETSRVAKLLADQAEEIVKLKKQKAELVAALNHCINAFSEFEKDSKLPMEKFQYNVVFTLSGYLLGALDNAKKAIGVSDG